MRSQNNNHKIMKERLEMLVVTRIDGSCGGAPVACDYAALASKHMETPMMLLHVLDDERYRAVLDLAGNIGPGSREQPLEDPAELDRKRAKLALEHGHHMLDEAAKRVSESGINDVGQRQRHGDLTESLLALENQTRLLVMGCTVKAVPERDTHYRQSVGDGDSQHAPPDSLGAGRLYPAPQRHAGLRWQRYGVQGRGIAGWQPGSERHAVASGDGWTDTNDRWEQLRKAEKMLAGLESEITLAIRAGDVEPALHAYQEEHDIDIPVMGAWALPHPSVPGGQYNHYDAENRQSPW